MVAAIASEAPANAAAAAAADQATGQAVGRSDGRSRRRAGRQAGSRPGLWDDINAQELDDLLVERCCNEAEAQLGRYCTHT